MHRKLPIQLPDDIFDQIKVAADPHEFIVNLFQDKIKEVTELYDQYKKTIVESYKECPQCLNNFRLSPASMVLIDALHKAVSEKIGEVEVNKDEVIRSAVGLSFLEMNGRVE